MKNIIYNTSVLLFILSYFYNSTKVTCLDNPPLTQKLINRHNTSDEQTIETTFPYNQMMMIVNKAKKDLEKTPSQITQEDVNITHTPSLTSLYSLESNTKNEYNISPLTSPKSNSSTPKTSSIENIKITKIQLPNNNNTIPSKQYFSPVSINIIHPIQIHQTQKEVRNHKRRIIERKNTVNMLEQQLASNNKNQDLTSLITKSTTPNFSLPIIQERKTSPLPTNNTNYIPSTYELRGKTINHLKQKNSLQQQIKFLIQENSNYKKQLDSQIKNKAKKLQLLNHILFITYTLLVLISITIGMVITLIIAIKQKKTATTSNIKPLHHNNPILPQHTMPNYFSLSISIPPHLPIHNLCTHLTQSTVEKKNEYPFTLIYIFTN